MSLADPADNRRQTTRTAKSQTVFLCEIMQLAAFLCVICAICGRIHARVLNLSAQRNPNVSRRFRRFTQTNPKTTLTTNCLSLRYNAACCIPLRHLRYLRENNTQEYSINIHRRNPSISRRFTQTKPKTTLISPNCLSLRNNAACCIPLRDLRYLRENIHIRVLNQFTNKKPQCLPQISLITQTKPKTTTTSQTVFLCEIMQLAAFLCVICVICGRIFTQEYSIYCTKKPQCLPQISQIHADKPQNPKTTLTTNCLSLRYNAACCIPLRDLRDLRENTRKSTQSIYKEETPMSPADFADLRRRNPKPQNSINLILSNLSTKQQSTRTGIH